MKKLWGIIGRIVFWVTLPLLYLYLRFGTRARLLLVSGDEALMVKGWLGNGRWMLPGGGLRRGEDPGKGILRELEEEMGLKLTRKDLRSIGKFKQTKHGMHFGYYLFIGDLRSKADLRPQRLEILTARWIKIDTLNEHNAQQHVLQAVEAWRKHA